MGKFLTIGQGPYEFFQSSRAYRMKFYRKDNNRYACIYNFMQGELYGMNIDESIKNQELSISKLNDSLPKSLFDYAFIDSVTFFGKEIIGKETQQIRYFSEEQGRGSSLLTWRDSIRPPSTKAKTLISLQQ